MQQRAVGHHSVNERGRHVDLSDARTQHALDQIRDLAGLDEGRRQLAAAAAGDEHPARLVDPELLPAV